MPRLSARKIIVYLLCIGSFFFLVINIHVQKNGPISLGLPVGFSFKQYDIGFNTLADEKIEETNKNNENSNFQLRKLEISEQINVNTEIPAVHDRPWYMKDGQIRPKNCEIDPETGERHADIFPEEKNDDRLIDQLMYVPPEGFIAENQDDPDIPLKKILFWNGASSWGIRPGRGVFLKEKCPVSTCVIATQRREAPTADLVVFKDHFTMPGIDRIREQLWMIFMLESPLHTQVFKHPEVFNWTATYRSDSTVVAPYERWQYYNENVKTRAQEVNYAANKTKKVAWFVSNCGAKNGRLEYARNLSSFIDVDIYGSCGSKRCPRSSEECTKMLDTDYKFYLAFENSNCKDYITEKFYVNGLEHNVLPIVMGARKEDYEKRSPHKSFIHVDDFAGPAELAEYLKKVDSDDELYNSYFKWKGTGEMINTKFFCRMCAMLHDPKERTEDNKFYKNINEWWRGKGTCINGSWKKYHEALEKKKAKEKNKELESV